MTILSKLNLSDMSRSKMIASPEARLRHKMLAALEEQITAANADKNGETYVKRALRSVTDQETGEQVKREVPVRFKRWWWTDASNAKTYIQLRYGNKPLELAKGKPTIELKNADELVSTLEQVFKAVAEGELDTTLMAAKIERAKRLKPTITK
ncbi:MAG: hypothetical protein HOC93_06570 [Phycisphaerae bacterium]|jgi:hypothetical protein|nr:hypothetical protein [Phycisphaerae bacterium]